MKNEYKGHTHTYSENRNFTNEIFTCAHLSNLLSRGGAGEGRGNNTFKSVSLIEILYKLIESVT